MEPLSPYSPGQNGLPPPEPADAHLLALGFAAWDAALASASDGNPDRARSWSTSPAGKRLLAAVFGNSPFLSRIAAAEWAFLTRLAEAGPEPLFDELRATTTRQGDGGENTAELMRRLRIAKRRVALLAGVAELAGWWSLEQQMQALSTFADAAINAAIRHLLRAAAAKGALVPADAEAPEGDTGLIVLGMGKLGGGELNYSSDIDLILLYDAARPAVRLGDGAQAFFTRLARDLVRILDERTGDGYVFRTDLRLRPDPRSTPLAMSVPAALTYYETVGQNWERAALIKARQVAGDTEAGGAFLADLQPFIWRRHLDFAAIQDIHSIKRQIQAHKAAAESRSRGTTSRPGAAASARSSFSPRRSS